MTFNFKKNTIVGVSVNSEVGLEIAQIDYVTKTVLKYGSRQLAYDNARRQIADLDIFKETLQDLLFELQIPKGSEIVLNIPAILFRVTDYPAALNEDQVSTAIEEELTSHPIFQNTDACISAVALPNSTIQFNKIAYVAAQKVVLTEIAMQIKDLGYRLVTIDTSVNSTLNALIYNERVDISPDISWVLVLVENNCCRIIPMQGKNYVDSFEERISIGEVLGDAENYSTVVNAISPIIKNLPSQCLYVVSKTNLISAKVLADKLTYSAPIVHQEANNYASSPFLEIAPDVNIPEGNMISLDVIGAAINKDFAHESTAHFNLFNASLGDVYLLEQPPIIKLGSFVLVFSMSNMIIASIIVAVLVCLATVFALVPLNSTISQKQEEIAGLKAEINKIQKYLDENKDISSDMFDEGIEIKVGLSHNKNVYTYYTIVGTEIPKKLWLTSLDFGKYITIEGQADNLESVYSFFRNIKDYNPESNIKLQKLGLATNSDFTVLSDDAKNGNEDGMEVKSLLTSMNADFYEFKISNAPEEKKKSDDEKDGNSPLPDLEPIE